jgi:hypothetical protein
MFAIAIPQPEGSTSATEYSQLFKTNVASQSHIHTSQSIAEVWTNKKFRMGTMAEL